MQVPAVHVDYVGGTPPTENGNYLVVNTMTTEQFTVRVHRHDSGDEPRFYSAKDCMCHDASNFSDPEYRWYRIKPLTKAQCVELATPVMV